ncbi:FAD/NAD(P)-binding domain-containing protein [Pyrenochaeta sp. DS3sAY3a]|nr:FAD/NAD(P)-binding domain-containing protein [Pyrenochaeta sp. DS3sAY3a]
MTSAWEDWEPFSGQSPPSDFLESIYLDEIEKTQKDGLSYSLPDGKTKRTEHPNPWYRQNFKGYSALEQPMYSDRKLRVIATGAGATGIQAARLIGQLMENCDLVVYEKNSGVGGTWRVSQYPGCACDIPSHCYQFYWNRNPNWSSFYSPATEILQYLEDTVDKFDLKGFFKFEHEVIGCDWNADEGMWHCRIRRPDGTEFVDKAHFLLNTSGPISILKWPDIQHLDKFEGKLMHTGSWDSSYDLAGKKVAVIGSGSSAVQVVPSIQPGSGWRNFELCTVASLVNARILSKVCRPGRSQLQMHVGPEQWQERDCADVCTDTAEQKEQFRNDPALLEKYIRMVEEDLGGRYPMQNQDSEVQKVARRNMEIRMRQAVDVPAISNHIIPTFGLGCRRLSPGDDYMRSFKKGNVHFVPHAVARLNEHGIVDVTGAEHPVDVVICATGYDTGFVPRFPVNGRSGMDLKSFNNGFPRSYNGIMTPFFPNFAYVPGPGSPGSHGGVFAIVEWQLRWVCKMLKKMQRELIKTIEPKESVAEEHYYHQHALMKRLVYSQPCASWYKNGRIVGPVCAQYPGSRLHWHEFLRKVRYEDFEIEYCYGNRFAYLGNGYTREDIEGHNLTWYFDILNRSELAFKPVEYP